MRDVDLAFAGVTGQLRLLADGAVTARRLTEVYLARIARHDRTLNAYRTVLAADALRAADEADRRRAHGDTAPLLGIPVAVKEDQPIAGLPTTAGTHGMHTPADSDGEVVRRLRAAGAVILGQTRTPELCLFAFSGSRRAGLVGNPWAPERTPGGSSGGSAAAVAAGLASAATASDGGGSIRMPAAFSGLVGLKPQRDRLPVAPRDVVWTGLAGYGVLTRTVADTALLLEVLGDGYAAAAAAPPGRRTVAVSLRPWTPAGTPTAETVTAVHRTARALADLGHRVVFRNPRYLDRSMQRSYGPRYLAAAAEEAARLDDPGALEPDAAALAAIGRRTPPRWVAAAHRYSCRVAAAATEVFAGHDVLLTPTVPHPALPLGAVTGPSIAGTILRTQRAAAFTALWNVTGTPAISVPAGFTANGLPLAVQLAGPADSEPLLLSLAAQLEQPPPRPPLFS